MIMWVMVAPGFWAAATRQWWLIPAVLAGWLVLVLPAEFAGGHHETFGAAWRAGYAVFCIRFTTGLVAAAVGAGIFSAVKALDRLLAGRANPSAGR